MKKLAILFVLSIVACSSNYTLLDSKQSIEIYISDGSRQCMPKSGQTLKQTEELLVKSNIKVADSKCGYLERIYPTVCGGKTGGINIHSIDISNLELAKSLGFAELRETISHHKTNCR